MPDIWAAPSIGRELDLQMDGFDRQVNAIAVQTMNAAHLQTIDDINEIACAAFLTFEQAVACEVFSHIMKSMPFDEPKKGRRKNG